VSGGHQVAPDGQAHMAEADKSDIHGALRVRSRV
jgi:hypothetical protein